MYGLINNKLFQFLIYLVIFLFFSYVAIFSYYFFKVYINDKSNIYSKYDLGKILCDLGVAKVIIEDKLGIIKGLNCK